MYFAGNFSSLKTMKTPQEQHPVRRAFTLIELLTVIAIIGILAAILIPVVGRVRDQAVSSLCVGNLREIGVAAHLYAAESNDLLPPSRAGNIAALQPSTRDIFDKYLAEGYDVFYCRNEGIKNTRSVWDPYGSWNTPAYQGGYSIGYFWLGNPTVPGYGDPNTYWLDTNGSGSPRDEYLIRVSEEDVAQIAICVDHTDPGGGPGTWTLRHPLSTDGTMNVLYGDIHVETKSAGEIIPRWDGSIGW